jgi:hypothetical protein
MSRAFFDALLALVLATAPASAASAQAQPLATTTTSIRPLNLENEGPSVPAITVGNLARYNGSKSPDGISILDYGGKNDGTGDNGPACEAALAALSLTVGGTIVFPPGTYNFNTTCQIPAFREPAVVTFKIEGAILATSALIHILERRPTDQANASALVGAMFRFHGGVFQGSSQSGQVGIWLGASYNSVVSDTQFNNLDIGFDGVFALHTLIMNARTRRNLTNDFKFESGVGNWGDATVNNSQSNDCVLQNVRIFSSSGQEANIKILASDSITIRDSIVEGENPVNAVYFDDQRSTTVKLFQVYNLHSENAPSNAIFYMRGVGGGNYTFEKVFSQTAPTFLDVSNLGTSIISIKDIPWVKPFTTAFKLASAYGTFWNFDNWGAGNTDITDTKWWQDSRVPQAIFQRSREVTGRGVYLNGRNIFLGSPNNRGSSSQGIFSYGGLFFAPDNTYHLGSIGASNFRPKSVSVGTGGISSDGGYSAKGIDGVTCSGPPTASFATVNGIVTHC